MWPWLLLAGGLVLVLLLSGGAVIWYVVTGAGAKYSAYGISRACDLVDLSPLRDVADDPSAEPDSFESRGLFSAAGI